MKILHTHHQIKNGLKITIREATLEDASQLLTCIKNYIADSEYIPKLEKEITLTLQQEEEWIKSFIESSNSILLVALHNNIIVGNLDITGQKRKLMQHTAVIGMGMLKEYRNIGLGTALFTEALKWAKSNDSLEILWLQVYTSNILAVNLYTKMGFKSAGIIKNFFKHNNIYYDNLTMSLKL